MDPSHDPPPPPYSETDIYSQPGNPPSAGPPSNTRRTDDAVSSSTGDVQYTPPLTPTTSRSVAAEPTPAVAAFFDSRPALTRTPSERLEHTITINAETRPENLAPHPEFAARDVTEQDWRTFANFLLPDHAARSNEAVAERKLRAESDGVSARGDAEAQLGSIRSDDGSQSRPAPRREDVERTVDEWNTFFFGPRGISILLTPELEAGQMPGAWDESFNNQAGNVDNSASNTNANTRARQGENPFTWGLGGIRVTQDGISFGNILEAHRRGIRVGQFSADQSGITYGGRSLVPGQDHAMGARGYYGVGCPTQAGPFQPRRGPAAAGNVNGCHSSSSESDSSSSDGDEIEELLDYDELLDDSDGLSADQFSLCSEALKRWLNAPAQHVTRADLRALKGQMRVLKHQRKTLPSAERKERKKELKALLKATRGLAKRQKQERRQVRRQVKQQKRAERRERKQQQREIRRAQRDHARGRASPPAPPAPCGTGVPAPPAPPPVPGAFPTPHAPPGLTRSPFAGRARPWGAYRGRESFFPHHVAPYGWPHAEPSNPSFHRGHHEGFTKAVKKLEDRLVERTAELSRLESEMARNTSTRGWSAKRMEGRKYGLEKEIEALQSSMEGLQMQADNEYAKLIAAEGEAAAAART